MARYKQTEAGNGQGLFLSVNLREQLLPGTFEYMLNDLVGKEIDISVYDGNYKNDATGSKAIPPAALIKLIIYGYIKGIISSRRLMNLNNENIIAKALTGDMRIHWTTIADFISANSEEFQETFVKVLAYCGELDLIEGEEFATDGRRMRSNASKDMSGTKEELEKKVEVYRRMAKKHVAKHLKQDAAGETGKEEKDRYKKRQEYLKRQVEKISGFLKTMEKKEGSRGREIKSNVTDNESAMISGASGCLQGYIGIAVADKKNQIIIAAEAVGTANEGKHLPGIIDGALNNMKEANVKTPEGKRPVFMCDANYFSEENFRACEERGVEAIIPDDQYGKERKDSCERRFEAADFEYREEEDYYECPCGKKLEFKRSRVFAGKEGKSYMANAKDCRECPQVGRCVKSKKDKKDLQGRQLFITKSNEPGSLCSEMRKKLSTEEYQNQYAYRIQIIEPVFANITYCKGMSRFTLRGKKKVNGQWTLYCIAHNLGKCLEAYNKKREAA